MNRTWTLVLSFAASCLTQDSPNRTLFLVSCPEVLHAGSTTSVAVTVFADSPGNLIAEMAHNNIKVAQKGQFQGGVTSVLMLPPFPGFLSQHSLLNLTVRGYKENQLLFTNTTTLIFNLRTISSFIQTDKSSYKLGGIVKVRVVTLQLDNKPYKGRVEISLVDPSGKSVESWNSQGNLGITSKEFTLPKMSHHGKWVIAATVNGVTDEKSFIVALHDVEALPFDVMVKTPSRVLFGDVISGSVRSLYPHGQPVCGTLEVILKPFVNNSTSPSLQTQIKKIYGSAQFSISRDQFLSLYSSSATGNNSLVLHIIAQVNDTSTGLIVNETVEVHVLQNKFQLLFLNFPSTLKPSLNFSANLKIVRYDRKPLSLLDLRHPVVFQVTQRTSLMNSTTMTLTLPVPKNGNVLVQFQLQDQVEMVFIQTRFQSNVETLTVYNNYSSPTGSYIQIRPVSKLPAQIGLPLQLYVESTIKLERLHFVVSSKGLVVAAGTENNSSSVTLTPELSWYPEACITISYIQSGEITSDTTYISIEHYNHVTLTWSSERAQPGEQVSLTVAGSESRFQAGIMATARKNDALQSNLDHKDEQKCTLKIMTNAQLYMKNQLDGPINEEDKCNKLILEQYWTNLMWIAEPLLWLDQSAIDKTWTSGKITVPDGVTCLEALAVVMSENLGIGFTPVPKKLTISKDLSLSLVVPSHLIRGEEIVLEVNVINHLEQETEVIVLVAQSDAFEFVLMDPNGAFVLNAQTLNIGGHASASALFPIRALAIGEMEISVDAVSAEASDGLVDKIWVKPEGLERIFSHTLFLEVTKAKQDTSRLLSFTFPPNLVPGSQKANVALGGDILALSINNLDSLVKLPTGCGEQNMVHFAPSVYVLQYLEKSGHDDEGVRSKALSYIIQGYEKQLSYQRDDGSFSAFGNSDPSGSTWLTAFVVRCLLKAQPYMQIDDTVLNRAIIWLLKQQGSKGEFTEAGKLIHTEMQGGTDDSPVALTAFVLLAFLEDTTYSEMYEDNVSLALRYLEREVSSGVVSNYSLCLVAYALALGRSTALEKVLSDLLRRADNKDGVMMWTTLSNNQQQPSVQIEMASYVLLILFMRGNFLDGIALMKWLSIQRNYLGGFGTTQDTVIALQALSYYAAFSGANAINLRFNMSSPVSSTAWPFNIDSTNYRGYQSQEINPDMDLPLHIYMEGRGFAIFQLNIFYNVNGTQDIKTDEDAFILDADLTHTDSDHIILSACTRLNDNQAIDHTGMAILEVGIISGFSLLPRTAIQGDFIRKVEKMPDRVILYLEAVTKAEVCVTLPFIRTFKVARVQDAVLQIYDYYEPTRKTTRTYNSDNLHKVDSCSFCGQNCKKCMPGITISVNSHLFSHSTSTTSFRLTSLFAGVLVFIVSV